MNDPASHESRSGLAVRLTLAVLVVIAVGPHILDALPDCGFKRLTGFHCPGCGSTRAFSNLVQGEFSAALGMNPLVILGLPVSVFAWLAHSRRKQGEDRMARSIPRGWVYGLAVVVTLFWVLRNVPSYPFTLLAP